jgi:predicted RNA-binding Zn ribbon-like protein
VYASKSIADLPLVAGHPALDLVNTVEPRLPVAERHDHLAAPADLLTWAQRADVIDAGEAAAVQALWGSSPATAVRALAAARETREALAAVLTGLVSTDVRAADTGLELEFLQRGWAGAAARAALVADRDGGAGEPAQAAARLVIGPAPATMITDRVCWLAVELLRDLDVGRLGCCPVQYDGCGWFFIDRSRNHSRRWCTMEACGSQEKARRLTARRRQVRATGISNEAGS